MVGMTIKSISYVHAYIPSALSLAYADPTFFHTHTLL